MEIGREFGPVFTGRQVCLSSEVLIEVGNVLKAAIKADRINTGFRIDQFLLGQFNAVFIDQGI